MKVFNEEINVSANTGVFYLDDVFKQVEYSSLYGEMMDIVHYPISFLNKTVCGNGGTTGMIRYALDNNKGLLVLVPNVSIVKSKEDDFWDNEDICCVYGGSGDINPDAQIVIATYDQFPRLLRTLRNTGVKSGKNIFDMLFWAGRTVVVDEYHKLIDESGYREICVKITQMITKIKSPVILMSATPSDDYAHMLRELLPEWIIRKYNVVYDNEHYEFDTRLDIWEAKKGDLKDVIGTMLKSQNNKHICVFYNSVADIKKLITQLDDDRIEVLCSAQSKDKVGKYYSDKFNNKKKLHFMTSAYFTGFDILCDECKCVIVTSNEFDYLCVSQKDIQQIIGRFRMEGGDVRHNDNHIWYIKSTPDQKNYLKYKNTFDKEANDIRILGDKWKDLSDGIERMHRLIRTKDILHRFDIYKDVNTLNKSLTEYGFRTVKRGEITGFTTFKKRKHISFKKAKELLLKGIKVDIDDYPDVNELEEFMKVKGESALRTHQNTKTIIHNWYKAHILANGQDLEKGNVADIFGIKLFGRYNAGFLMACLEYIGVKRDYEKLPYLMQHFMQMVVIPWKLDSKGKKQDHTWLVISITPKIWDFFDDSINSKDIEKSQKMGVMDADRKLSYETSNSSRSYARTSTLEGVLKEGGIPTLKGIPLYDWVNEDKPNRLPAIKKGEDWSRIKTRIQGKISDMYADTQGTYRYLRGEMDRADYIICDIDGGMTFTQFKEEYKQWTWIAYPTINNITEDWTKFRVIVPLAHTIKLEGEHNLKVLKALRTIFCNYEDPVHQVYSFINYEDFSKLVGNDGQIFDIPQEFVDCLNMCITTSYDYNDRKFNMSEVVSGETVVNTKMTIDRAKDLFLKKLLDPEEGARHRVLYPIKKGLSPEDRLLFENWLGEVYPSYLTHWRSHKVK